MFKTEVLQDLKGLAGIPLFLVIGFLALFFGYSVLFYQLVFGFVLSYAVVVFFRVFFFRRRPDGEKYSSLLGKIDAGSFPSMHSMRAGVLAVLLSYFFGSFLLGLLFFLLAFGVAVSRVLQKRHFISDVFAGLILGFVIGLICVWFMGKV